MKELLRLAKNEQAMNLLEIVQELEKCFEAKSFSVEEEEYHKKEEEEILKQLMDIMKGE